MARDIWQSGLSAVDSAELVRSAVRWNADGLRIMGELFPTTSLREILVLGCGKAGSGMVAGLEASLAECPLTRRGWVQVPDDCVRPTDGIRLFGARPAGFNFPTERGVEGSQHILELARYADPRDLCIVLISGGGSALLPAPTPPLTLADKLAVTKTLSSAGADIRKLNTVRKQLSQIKGGKLAAACRAERLVTLVVSDILGDPLDLIASGPTVPAANRPQEALQILQQFEALGYSFPPTVYQVLRETNESTPHSNEYPPVMRHHVIGNNATAVHAAAERARQLGFVTKVVPPEPDGTSAEFVGRSLAQSLTQQSHASKSAWCMVWGGEPTVTLCDPTIRGKGGRNQHAALAALEWFWQHGTPAGEFAILAGGTDGEDGPTDAAGAWWDTHTFKTIQANNRSPRPYLDRCDAYHYFRDLGSLLQTGPTHTNVCDLRVAVWLPTCHRLRPSGQRRS